MIILLLICVAAGALGGFLQGMVGVGTGIVVIPLLTFLLPYYGIPVEMAIHVALATSMAAITVSSIAAAVSHHQHQNIRWDIFKKIVCFSVIGSVLGALMASYMPARILEIIFAFFMFYTAFKMFRQRKDHLGAEPPVLSMRELGLGGLIIGITASIVGIGGGLFMVPFLRSRNLEMRHAVGTATLVGLPVAIMGTLVYILTGLAHTQQNSQLLGYLHWPAFLAIAFSATICAFIGAKLIKAIKPVVLQRIFAVCIIIVGIKMLLS